jgi:hypothetical protein
MWPRLIVLLPSKHALGCTNRVFPNTELHTLRKAFPSALVFVTDRVMLTRSMTMLRHGTELEQSKTVAASLLVVVPASSMYLQNVTFFYVISIKREVDAQQTQVVTYGLDEF